MASFPLYRICGAFLQQRSLLPCNKLTSIKLFLLTKFVSSKQNQSREKIIPNRIYTRTGDNGSSGLFTGERRSKDDAIFEALGSTDELTSTIGFAREFVNDTIIRNELEKIQCIIQDLQATIATPKSSSNQFQQERTKWNIDHLVDLETWIDRHSENLPQLKNFILPSGGQAACALHMARAVCRRAERRLCPLLNEGLELSVLQYLNRLSSYLFTIARVCSKQDGFEEVIYQRPKPSYHST